MPCNVRKVVRLTKLLLAGVTVFWISWIASVNEWHGGVRWRSTRGIVEGGLSTMRTIVAYSEGKQAEMDRPSPVTCDRLPAFPDIPIINRTWSGGGQEPNGGWQRVGGTDVMLYAAFYDDRTPQRYVRILASFQGRTFPPDVTLFCQTRSQNPYDDAVEVVAAKPLEIWWHEWDLAYIGVETPLLLSCPLTESLYRPSAVSVVTEPCDDPTNAFSIEPSQIKHYNRTFTICVKDMNFDRNIAQNLVEWIETNKILGVDMIDMYIDNINKESENVLAHYQSDGYVRLFHVPIKHKPDRNLWQRRKDHIITYNDCLYRNIRESKFIVPLDVDEIMLPKLVDSWPELLKRFSKQGWNPDQNSAVLVQNVFFFDFMQDLQNYKHRNISKNKMYTKRDDVRILNTGNLEVGEVELMYDKNSYNNAVEHNIERTLNDKYKSRCGKDLPVPKMARHIVSSAVISPVGSYSKSMMLTKKVLTAFNHYPLASLGAAGFTGWSAPFEEVQLNHYKESCNTTMVSECGRYGRRARVDRAAMRLRTRLVRSLADAPCPINTT